MSADDRTWSIEEVIKDPAGWAAMMARRMEQAGQQAPRISEEEVRVARLRAAGFGPRYWNVDWNQVPADIAKAVREYAAAIREHMREGRGLLLVGGVGCGKSSVLALICLEACKYGEVAYVFAPDLYRALHQGTPSDEERLAYWQDVDLLLLDDVDRLYASDWLLSRLDSFAEYRYARKLATCATANNWGAVAQIEELGRMRDRWRETMTYVRCKASTQRRPGAS